MLHVWGHSTDEVVYVLSNNGSLSDNGSLYKNGGSSGAYCIITEMHIIMRLTWHARRVLSNNGIGSIWNIWKHLGISGSTREHSEAFRSIWEHLGVSGSM